MIEEKIFYNLPFLLQNLFDREVELLPSVNELFELELAYLEYHFLGFVDGIGWYVRKNDLKKMVAAYEDVFTFHQEELERFKQLLREVFADD